MSKERQYKELAHIVSEAEKSQDLSANCRPRRADGIRFSLSPRLEKADVPAHRQRVNSPSLYLFVLFRPSVN